jgi:hypothetical protein
MSANLILNFGFLGTVAFWLFWGLWEIVDLSWEKELRGDVGL